MARPIQKTITCPQCGQPFPAIMEQLLDVGVDPGVKDRLLSGRVNVIACPHCGYQGAVSTPVMYHDPDKQLAIIHVPMELQLPTGDRERIIGDMTNAIMRSLPEDAPKGYLLQPSMALTMQGLVEQVLEADGITREMLDAERKKIELLGELVEAKSGEVDRLLDENFELFDRSFLELLSYTAQSASQGGDSRTSLRLLNIRQRLMETTEAGQEMLEEQQALIEASEEIQELGEGITREQYVDLIANAAYNPKKVEALAALGRVFLDYTTFQLLTGRIEAAQSDEEAEALSNARETLLAISAEYEKQSRAIIEQAVNTLKLILQSPDIKAAIHANLNRIDQTFLSVLQANLEESRRSGNVEVSRRLQQVRDEVLQLLEQAAPPEVRLLNQLLAVETDEEAVAVLSENSGGVTDELLAIMEDLAQQLRQAGNEASADRLDTIVEQARTMV